MKKRHGAEQIVARLREACEALGQARKQHRRRRLPGSSANSCVRHKATQANHV